MKLEKAIEILELNVKSVGKQMPTDTLTAVNLGIEAQKCVLAIRHHPFPDEVLLLPGETKD